MKLGFNLDFDDLDLAGLKKLDLIFLDYILKNDQVLYEDIIYLRSNHYSISASSYSKFLLSISPYLDDFLAELFNISKEVLSLRVQHKNFDVVYECKRKFLQRYALKKYSLEKIHEVDVEEEYLKLTKILGENFTAENFAKQVVEWQLNEDLFTKELDIAAKYGAFLIYSQDLKSSTLKNSNLKNHVLFTIPQKINKSGLMSNKKIEKYKQNKRTGFDYSDVLLNLSVAMNEAYYCIYCHKQGKDSCSKGLNLENNKDITELGIHGCPLKQKISEMNYVKARGFNLSALAIIIIDNPMLAATGHRICNDCSKACIYQKQDPVNIPLIESNIFEETLKLPYGVEIYFLLTRWNPLNIISPLPKESTNYNMLVAGLGPAGFSICYYLLRSGHNVVAIDGLKINPLDFNPNKPIKYWSEYKQRLSERVPSGFGGVAEYGITIRWDKNNLNILRIILERHNNFRYYSGIRLGSNITTSQAFNIGFDHIAFCTGAGKPKVLNLENFNAKGVRIAADFLMTLQNNGAFLEKSNANMVIRMPIVIIGGGLTSIDAATESLYYYKAQVERFLVHYKALIKKYGKDYVYRDWTEEDKEIAKEFISHAKLFANVKDPEYLKQIFQSLGGSTIYYGGKITDSPAYKTNYHELLYAMALGVNFVEDMNLSKINIDQNNYVKSLEFDHCGKLKVVQARTVLTAIGIESKRYLSHHHYSFLGDCNPKYVGSVVKALASSKESYEDINRKLLSDKPRFKGNYKDLFTKLGHILISKVKEINILSDGVVKLIIYSPLVAKNFKPGQFFRLQNYSKDISKLMEPIAITPVDVNNKKGLIEFVIYTIGKSSSLCKLLLKGEEVVLMGPVGSHIEIPENSKILLINNDGDMVRISPIYKALKKNNCDVLFYDSRALEVPLALDIINTIDQIIAIGSNEFIERLQKIKGEIFGEKVKLIVNIHPSMQCMMQGICGQCILNVKSGKNYIFACSRQYHNVDEVDFVSLKANLQQNSVQEKLQKLL